MMRLKQEQLDIEARMKQLEELEQKALQDRRPPTTKKNHPKVPPQTAEVMITTPPRAPEPKTVIEKVPEAVFQQFYDPSNYKNYHDVYVKNRERNIAPKPFSFETRERLKKAQPASRSSRKQLDLHVRTQKQANEVCYPAGSRAPFVANTVPPSTFTRKYENMVIESEEKKIRQRQELERKRQAAETDSHSLQAKELYDQMISRPLRQRDRYQPMPDKIKKQKPFKARKVPKSVTTPQWRTIAEAEILRKMDIKEAARLKLAEYDREMPGTAVRSRSAPNTPAGGGGMRNKNLTFSPQINRSVPDYPALWEKQRLERIQQQATTDTTVVEEFSLSKSSLHKTRASIAHDMAMDEVLRPETRWPYKSSRMPPKHATIRRSASQSIGPTRYTKSANVLMLQNSLQLVKRAEEEKRKQEEDEIRKKRSKEIASVLRRYGTGHKPKEVDEDAEEEVPTWVSATRKWKATKAGIDERVAATKPIWLGREPKGQPTDAEARAHAEDVASKKIEVHDADSSSSDYDDDKNTTVKTVTSDTKKPEEKKKKRTSSASSSSSSSSSYKSHASSG
eukprot:TRINITY_DN15091_c0_g1_i1.p1 TRINITY_DN15091_c0_g1~~TRINITY_DN15091_c0_g1_i1.p1  ORF type:complete len:593 (+),score=160.28 TRINITY_DN15091_c0_g1_i1:88-1779(+)